MKSLILPRDTTPGSAGGELRIAYEQCGSGPPVVFVHGIGGNKSNWAPQMDGALAGFSTVALDLRGYGASALPDAPLKLTDFVEDVLSVMDHLHIRAAHLVGLSMGGLGAGALCSSPQAGHVPDAGCVPGRAFARGERRGFCQRPFGATGGAQ